MYMGIDQSATSCLDLSLQLVLVCVGGGGGLSKHLVAWLPKPYRTSIPKKGTIFDPSDN